MAARPTVDPLADSHSSDRVVTVSTQAATLMAVTTPDLPPQQPAPGPTEQPVYMVRQPQTSGLAVASLVLSIIGLVGGCCSFGVPSIIAIFLGHNALADTRKGAKGGHGMAVAGLTMGYIGVAPGILLSFWLIVGSGIGALSGTGQ